MAKENGTWIIRGLKLEDPACLKTPEELACYIRQVGFLPLFANSIPGFSVEEHTASRFWWSGVTEHDPWEWRRILPAQGELAYGKFFAGRAGFISRAWFPHFANWRRDGYDFDSRWEDERASIRQKRIMDCFSTRDEWFSFALKQQAGFGRGGEKNFEGTVTDLQMSGYLLIRDFRQRINKKGFPYGWPISVYTTPESLWGYEHISSAYSIAPAESRELIYEQVRKNFPEAAQEELDGVLGWTR